MQHMLHRKNEMNLRTKMFYRTLYESSANHELTTPKEHNVNKKQPIKTYDDCVIILLDKRTIGYFEV